MVNTARKQSRADLLSKARAARIGPGYGCPLPQETGIPDRWTMAARELVEKVVDTRYRRRHLYHLVGPDGKRLPTAAVVILDFLIDQAVLHESKTVEPGFFCTAPTMERHTGIKERTQRDHIKRLVAAGYIKHRNRGGYAAGQAVRWFKINYRAIKAALIEVWPWHYA